MSNFKVVVDGGHALTTAGKRTPDGEREWTFNNKVVLALIEELKTYENVEVLRVDDPTGKRDVPLQERTDRSNSWGADIYMSVHHNASTGKWGTWTGSETFSNPNSVEGAKLAKLVHSRYVKAFGLRDRGTKTANFHVLRETIAPAILTEGGYMDSLIDIKHLRSHTRLMAQGKAIAEGAMVYLGAKKKVKEDNPVTVDKEKNASADASFKVAQEWVKTNNVSDGTYPRRQITRQEVWAMIHNYAKGAKS